MAHIRARLLQDIEPGKLTRRQLVRRLAFTATAASVVGKAAPADAPVADANAKVRLTLEALVRDTPEVGLQVAAYLDASWSSMPGPVWPMRLPGNESMVTPCSCCRRPPKGVTATCMHILVEQHKLDYERIVKRPVEVHASTRSLENHRAGFPQRPWRDEGLLGNR